MLLSLMTPSEFFGFLGLGLPLGLLLLALFRDTLIYAEKIGPKGRRWDNQFGES
jgi:hypothetical protein